jgi:hypothetical protein
MLFHNNILSLVLTEISPAVALGYSTFMVLKSGGVSEGQQANPTILYWKCIFILFHMIFIAES